MNSEYDLVVIHTTRIRQLPREIDKPL